MAGFTILDRDRLRHAIVTLLAMALLAEYAAILSRAVRQRVIWALRPAEASVWAYLIEQADDRESACTGFGQGGDGPEEAMRLAMSFRLLASALGAMLAHAKSDGCAGQFRPGQSADCTISPKMAWEFLLGVAALSPRARLDTS